MKLAMQLTLDGLVQALRWRMHAIAEKAETSDNKDAPRSKDAMTARGRGRRRDRDDDIAGA